MKISNETKVGALTSIAIVFLILGFNFLKGKSLFKTGNYIYATFSDTKGLLPSYPVFVNGYQVGTVHGIEAVGKDLKTYAVEMKLKDDYQIPKNSLAKVNPNPLGSPTIEIELGDGKEFIKKGDTLRSGGEAGMLATIGAQVKPLSDKLSTTLVTMDSLLRNFNNTLNASTRANLQGMIANMNRVSYELIASTQSLQQMLNTQSGALAKSLNHVESFTGNLAANNGKLTSAIDNFEKTSKNLAEADIKAIADKMKASVTRLETSMAKLDSKDGTIGLLLNDKQLYNNLTNSTKSLNTLLDDLRVNPKRYVSLSFSVFGGKKTTPPPLKEPLPQPDTTGKRK
jgi:phospholipid/cholesterol/gamma-HCH transport system substrate-binding protein